MIAATAPTTRMIPPTFCVLVLHREGAKLNRPATRGISASRSHLALAASSVALPRCAPVAPCGAFAPDGALQDTARHRCVRWLINQAGRSRPNIDAMNSVHISNQLASLRKSAVDGCPRTISDESSHSRKDRRKRFGPDSGGASPISLPSPEHEGRRNSGTPRQANHRGQTPIARARLRTHCLIQKMTVAAIQMAEKKVWEQRS